MGLRSDQRNLTVTVDVELYEAVVESARARGMTVRAMLAAWMAAGVGSPVVRSGKRQRVRAERPDELFVSLPRDWIERTGVTAGSDVDISYSDDALVVRPHR